MPAPNPSDSTTPPAPTSTIKKPSTRRASTPVAGAVKASLPETLAPQLATLATGVPAQGEWLYEIKFDGYRITARIHKGKATLITRGGHDWSARMPELVREIEQMGIVSGWLDGEIIALDDHGVPSFNRLQKSFDSRTRPASGLVYFVFDIPFLGGYDLRAVALKERRRVLKELLAEKGSAHVKFSADFEADPEAILESACSMNLEGVIAKRADAPYVSRRSETWLKLKCKLRQEFVVAGYVDRSDGAPQIGSLLLGVFDDAGTLVSVGSVGTGWDMQEAHALKLQLAKIERPTTPFAAGVAKPGRWSKRVAGSERWVEPRVVAEVEFAEWTPDGQIRHASFIALREDKPAQAVSRETAKRLT